MMRTNLYNAVWRWHFYAGLLTLPFLILLALTGAAYLFKDEINDRLYSGLLLVSPLDSAPLAPSAVVKQAVAAAGGQVTGYVPPPAPDRAARVVVEHESGESRYVFVNPYDGTVLGELPRGEFGNLPLMNLFRRLHSLEQAGWPGNRLVEIMAGWALILAATGVYLWWPRGRRGGILTIRRDAGRRAMWRDVHAVTGVVAAAFIAFMALTGLPWSGVWGESLKAAVNRAGLGYPERYLHPGPHSTVPLHEAVTPAPWTIADVPLPASHHRDGTSIGIDVAVDTFERAGLAAGYAVSFPHGAEGVWSASVIPDRVSGMRTMHLDRYSGEVLFDARYDELGPAARAIEWGISVHTGQQFGRLNQLLMLLVCTAILVISVSAAVMWWKRRPRGSLGAPGLPDGGRMPRGFLLILILGGLLFPLVGASILFVLMVDALLPERLRRVLS